MKKQAFTKKFMSYKHHVIWFDTHTKMYSVAIERNGIDTIFKTWQEAMDAIDKIEEENK